MFVECTIRRACHSVIKISSIVLELAVFSCTELNFKRGEFFFLCVNVVRCLFTLIETCVRGIDCGLARKYNCFVLWLIRPHLLVCVCVYACQ